MVRSAVICFVKTPFLSKPKSRLAKSVGEAKALEVYLKLIACMEESFVALQHHGIQTIWAVNEQEGAQAPLWLGRRTWVQPPGTLGEKLSSIEEKAATEFDQWIFIGSDTPALTSDIIMHSLHELKTKAWIVGPSHDGGFYLWGSKTRLEKERWLNTTYSSSGTLQELTANLPGVHSLLPLPDLDKMEDLKSVRESISMIGSQARHELLRLIDVLISGTKDN